MSTKAKLILPNERHSSDICFYASLFFYWQAGVVEYLKEQDCNFDNIYLGGASAGALTATLAATDVDFYEATKLALSKSEDAGIWDRKEGLQGIWGPIIRTWLEELLPDDAVDKVNNRVRFSIIVMSFSKCGLTQQLMFSYHF